MAEIINFNEEAEKAREQYFFDVGQHQLPDTFIVDGVDIHGHFEDALRGNEVIAVFTDEHGDVFYDHFALQEYEYDSWEDVINAFYSFFDSKAELISLTVKGEDMDSTENVIER